MNEITIITASIAVLGSLFFLILLGRSIQVGQERTLRHHRKKDEGVADLLNYGSVIDDGVILCKNGALMAAWLYRAEDSANSTNEEKESSSARINQALANLGNGWMIHVDSTRVNAANYSERGLSHFPDRVTAAMDEERRRLFETLGNMFEGCHVLAVTYYPPSLAQAKFVELLFDDDEKVISPKDRSFNILKNFKKEIDVLESNLSSVFKMERLGGKQYEYEDGSVITHDELLQYLHYCLTGIMQPIILPDNPSYIDGIIGGQELWGGTIPKIGANFIQVVAIDGFPLESYPGILTALSDAPVNCRFSSRFIFMDRHQAEAAATKQKKKWQQKQRGLMDQVFNRPASPDRLNQDAIAMVRDADEALQELQEGLVAYGYYTAVVVLMSTDRSKLESSSGSLAKTINNLGFAARVETINTLDAFMGSLPGHGVENVRRPFLNTFNFSDLLPTSSIWTGENQAPCPFYPPLSPPLMHCVTTGSTPYRLNLHVRDVGHTLIVGATGAGKSTLLATLIAQAFRYPGNTVSAFDIGNSLYALCSACGGNHFEIGSESNKLHFSPFQYLSTPPDRAWGLDWVDKILALNGVITTPGDRNEIAEALVRLNQHGGKVSMTDFLSQVQSNKIRSAMQQYSLDGIMGDLLAAEEDGLTMSRFNVFEIERLMELGDKWTLPVLDYLFRRVERSLKGQPAWLFLDEAWLMLSHPAFAKKIKEWLKVFRRANCAVVMATQNLRDFANSPIFSDIVESTASKIFLPNIYARNEDTAEIYRKMGLNSQQINIVAGAVPKREYYHVSEKGKRLINLALGPVALSFVAASDRDTIADVKKFEATHGQVWPDVWLKERTGLNLNDFLVA